MREVLFADDSALIFHSAEEIQMIVDAFTTASSNFGPDDQHKKDRSDVPANSTTTRDDEINVDDTTLNLL